MARSKKNSIRKTFGPLNIILLVGLCIYVLSMFVMFGWGLITSLKTNLEYSLNPLGFPEGHIWEWEWNNYVITLRDYYVPLRRNGLIYRVGMMRMFINSIIYAVGLCFLQSFMQFFPILQKH